MLTAVLFNAQAQPGLHLTDDNPLEMPEPGSYGLRVLSPTLLELTLITTKDQNAAVTEWNFVSASGALSLPAPSAFTVSAGSVTIPVQAVGFKRRVLYAPLKTRDLRIANHLYLRLSSSVSDNATVEVYNPAGNLWGASKQFITQVNPLRYSPAIHVNHEGYMPGYAKKAMVGYYLGSMGELSVNAANGFRIIDANTGVVVHQGTLSLRRDVGYSYSPLPYQQVLEADFTGFNTPGEYRLQVPGLGASFSFMIDEGIAAAFARTYALGLYHQRCGAANEFPFTRHTHGACHTALVEVPTMASSFVNTVLAAETANFSNNPRHTAPRLKDIASSLYPFVNTAPFDASGGHHDAGDYSKYTINVAQLLHSLVFSVDAFNGVGELDNLGLPESADGKSDILQIAKWEADFLAKLQDADGGFYFLVYPKERRYEDDVLPDAGDGQLVFPKNTSATAAAVAALAEAGSSPLMRQQFPAAAANYMAKARSGWDFLQRAIAEHGRDGSYQKITHYGDEFMHDDELSWAAAAMFAATGEEIYHTELRAKFDPGATAHRRWSWWKMFEGYGCAVRTYVYAARSGRLPASSLNATYLAKCEAELRAAAVDQVRFSQRNAYGTSFPEPNKPFRSAGWYFSLENAFDIAAAYQLDGGADQLEALIANMNFEAGCNPLNLSYLTGIGWRRQRDIVHQYSQNDHRVLAPTGIPLGNVQAGFSYLANYGSELSALSFPQDGSDTGMYAPYDKWADTFNTTTEFVVPQQGRSLGAVALLMAKTSLKTQPWKSTTGNVSGIPASAPARQNISATLTAGDLDLSKARVLWEVRERSPQVALPLRFSAVNPGPQWVEVEAMLPDGRRVFVATNFYATAAQDEPTNSWQSVPQTLSAETVALFHLDSTYGDAAGRVNPLTRAGNTSFDSGNVSWMANRSGSAIRVNDLEDKVSVGIPNALLYASATQEISVESMIYIHAYKAYNRDSLPLLSLRKNDWNARIEFAEDKYLGPMFLGGQTMVYKDQARIASALTKEKWHHVRISLSRTAYKVTIDGVVIANVPSTDLTNWNGTGTLTLEAGNFDGWIDEIVVKNIKSAGSVNQPPAASIISPVANSSFSINSSIAISANASDSDGVISKVEFYRGGTKLGEDISAPYSLTWSNAVAGTYTLTARAFDNSGAAATSAPVNISLVSASTVSAPVLNPPGGAFTNLVQVALSSATADATIRYTTNGNNPTAASPLYSAPLSLTASATIKAAAFKSGLLDSAVTSGFFSIVHPNSTNNPVNASAAFLRIDSTSQGTWRGVYGADGYHVIANGSVYPGYVQVSSAGKQSWTWSSSTSELRALQRFDNTNRIAAGWYSSTNFVVNFNYVDGQTHRLGMYFMDWDNSARAQKVEVLHRPTGTVLHSLDITNFHQGKYVIWDVGGDLQIRITNLNPESNALLSGIFFDAVNSTSIVRNGARTKVKIRGVIGDTYEVQSSSNLKDWKILNTITLAAQSYEYEDPQPATGISKFYRAVKKN